ncbi:hypothetical protein BU088_05320 [Staphylococcus warneri]|nr:hypothetical protein D3P10_09995 [Staphylococcus warneri]PTI07352.1 hypothetical protein BU088_05320 [Staphylococcus warneri]PTI33355.1 hypothetical protein BU078_04495 [Staphylococcus warneri]QNQ44035.1 hypothetical protein IAR39_09475 [Staphylococcus warneri]RIN15168.1 hypothetical protein BU091_11095 [Staphylococcus warneri]
MINMSIYVAIILGLLFILIYATFWTFLYQLNYKRMNRGQSLNKTQIKINMFGHGAIAFVLVVIAIYLSYLK